MHHTHLDHPFGWTPEPLGLFPPGLIPRGLTAHRTELPLGTAAGNLPQPSIPFEERGPIPSGEANDSPPLPSGGRLLHFHQQWEESTLDTWVLQTVRLGLTLEFRSRPPTRFIQCPLSANPSKRHLMEEEIHHLLEMKAIEPVPAQHWGTGFYSIFFLVPKTSGGVRGILDLKILNQFISYHQFKMESLRSILSCIRHSD